MVSFATVLCCILTLFVSLVLPLAVLVFMTFKYKKQGAFSAWLLGLLGGSFAQNQGLRLAGFLGIFFSTSMLFGILSRQDLRWLRGLIRKK